MARGHRKTGQGDSPQLQPAAPSLLAEQPRFRAFKAPSQWLEEVEEQQRSRDIMARRAWGKELQNFFYQYQGKSGKPLGSHSQNNIRAAVLHFFKYHLGKRRGVPVHARDTGPAQGRGSPARRGKPRQAGRISNLSITGVEQHETKHSY